MPSMLNLSDPTIANQYHQMLISQYGGDSQQVRDIYNAAMQEFQNGGGASQFGGMPHLQNLLQTSQGAINKQYGTASTNLSDKLSAMGLSHSGIGVGAQASLSGEQSGALNDATTKAMTEADQYDMAIRNQQLQSIQMLLSGKNMSDVGNRQDQQQKNALWGDIGKGLGQFIPLAGMLMGGGGAVGASGTTADNSQYGGGAAEANYYNSLYSGK